MGARARLINRAVTGTGFKKTGMGMTNGDGESTGMGKKQKTGMGTGMGMGKKPKTGEWGKFFFNFAPKMLSNIVKSHFLPKFIF